MQIIERKTADLRPYENNPRKNDAAVEKVAESIKEFGFKVPIVITKDDEIIAGHTRLKAAERLGLKKVPVIIADDLTPEQIKAFRLADNKVAEFSAWDPDLLEMELEGISEIDMEPFGFMDIQGAGSWFEDRKRYDNEGTDEESEEYQEFIGKFEAKRTTDDCYTPDKVYDAIADWVAEKYKIDRGRFVRPFYPGGDYQKEKYKEDAVVVDNPPFSILSEIVKFYTKKSVKFFLFAPTLTLFSSSSSSSCAAISTGATVIYENGASVNTSFLTNLEKVRFRSAPDLYKVIDQAVKEVLKETARELIKNDYPDHVITSAMVAKYSKYGIEYAVEKSESKHIRRLDAQKEKGQNIFGSGYLVSEKAAAEKAAAEKAAAEKAAAEKWELSDRELEIVASLG